MGTHKIINILLKWQSIIFNLESSQTAVQMRVKRFMFAILLLQTAFSLSEIPLLFPPDGFSLTKEDLNGLTKIPIVVFG